MSGEDETTQTAEEVHNGISDVVTERSREIVGAVAHFLEETGRATQECQIVRSKESSPYGAAIVILSGKMTEDHMKQIRDFFLSMHAAISEGAEETRRESTVDRLATPTTEVSP